MDGTRFDGITRALATGQTRRRALQGLTGGAFAGLLGMAGAREVAALRTDGRPCERNAQCNSGVCRGPRGRKTCRCEDGSPPCSPGICCIGPSVCIDGACGDHCINRRKDGDETDQDCGGARCPKCRLNQDCKVDRDCVSGSCFASSFCGCAVDGNCPADTPFCDAPVCVQCRADDDCMEAGRRFCNQFGACRKCRDNAHCPAARPVCDRGNCVRCQRDGECARAQVCRAGRCRCLRDAGCPSGQSCANGRCVGACSTNENCPPGVACVNGACTGTCRPPGPCSDCSNNPDVSCCDHLCGGVTCCDFGQVCDQQTKTCS